MSNENYMIISLVLVLITAYSIFLKFQHRRRKKGKTPINAKVKEYKTITTEVSRNHWHSERSIIVELPLDGYTVLRKLQYDFLIFTKPFRVNQRIKVFWDSGQVFYWDHYENGIFQILPPFK